MRPASRCGLAGFVLGSFSLDNSRNMHTSLPTPQDTPSSTPVRSSRRRSLFWLGFVVGFGMLVISSCSGVAIALGLNQLSLAELQGIGSAWTPPPYTPEPTPLPVAVTDGSSAGSLRFAPQQAVRNLTNSRVNLRSTPGYLSKPASDVIGVIQPGASAVILGENQTADNLVWWRVRAVLDDGRTIEGWVAEATASGVQILGE
jgi:hypothetical protein